LGHPPEAVWNYTPRQLEAYLKLATARRKYEAAEYVSLTLMATRGPPDEVQKQLTDWTR